MSNTFEFIKGVGFTLVLLAAYVVGFGCGKGYMEDQYRMLRLNSKRGRSLTAPLALYCK